MAGMLQIITPLVIVLALKDGPRLLELLPASLLLPAPELAELSPESPDYLAGYD